MKELGRTDGPMSSAELADEYGCSASHMRDALRSLRRAGVVRRVDRGQYERVPAFADGPQMAAAGDGQDEGTENAAGSGRVPAAKSMVPVRDMLDKQRQATVESDEEIEEQPGTGIPIPVSSTQLLFGVAVLTVVVLFLQLRFVKESGEGSQEEQLGEF